MPPARLWIVLWVCKRSLETLKSMFDLIRKSIYISILSERQSLLDPKLSTF